MKAIMKAGHHWISQTTAAVQLKFNMNLFCVF